MIRSTRSTGFLSAFAIAACFLLLAVPPTLAFHLPALSQTHHTDRISAIMSKSALQTSTSSDDNNGASLSRDKLLSTLIHAALRGSQTISSLSDKARNGEIQFKEEGDARSALTIADTSAQRVIVSSILDIYPNLNLVGEEDETVSAEKEFVKELKDDLLGGYDWTLPSEGKNSAGDNMPPAELDMSQLVVFVDPLDGTREFVEGRLDNVQCLVGVCYKGTPIMGAIGLPFPLDKESNATEVVFGLVGKGIGMMCIRKNSEEIVNCPLPEMKQYQSGNTIYTSSGDSKSVQPVVDLAEEIFASKGGTERQILGATGNKLLMVAQGESTLSLLHNKTSLWDTAAPTAILSALGGKVTDYYGDPLVYDNYSKELGNKLGVIASVAGAGSEHDAMAEALRSNKQLLL